MGNGSSTAKNRQLRGGLKGAYAPPLPNVVLPPKLDPKVREYMATVPADKKGGDKMALNLKGHEISVTIPRTKELQGGGSRPIKPGDKFKFKWGNRERVIASTLNSLPGTTVVEAKPVIYSNTSDTFYHYSKTHSSTRHGQGYTNQMVQALMQEAQTNLLQQAVEQGCNAVLGINCNITTDSSGEDGSYKIVIVTLIGTPCVVMRMEELPAVRAEVVVEPSFVY